MLATVCATLFAMQSKLPESLTNVHRIVMMGDSITQQGGSPNGYVTLVANTLQATYPDHPIEVVNVGIGGQKAPDMLARFQRDVIDKKPDVVTISVGVNDVWHDFRTPDWTARVPSGESGRGVKLPTYVADVDKMIQAAQAAKIHVVLLSPTLVYEDLDCAENRRLNDYVRAEARLARERGVVFVDLNSEFRKAVKAYQDAAGKSHLVLTVDGVHMNDAGNALMAASVLRTLGVPVPNNIQP